MASGINFHGRSHLTIRETQALGDISLDPPLYAFRISYLVAHLVSIINPPDSQPPHGHIVALAEDTPRHNDCEIQFNFGDHKSEVDFR